MASNIHLLAHGYIKQLESLCSGSHERDIKASFSQAEFSSGIAAVGKLLPVVALTQGLVQDCHLCLFAGWQGGGGIAFNFQVCHTLLV